MSVKVCLLAASAALILSSAVAASASAQSVAFNATITSDYVFRGYSQSDEHPAIQGGVDASWESGFYVGAWASSIDFNDDTSAEVDLYGGYRTSAAGYDLDFGVVSYWYRNEPSGSDYNFVELKAAASRAVGPATLGAAVYYSPDFFGADEAATYLEVNGAYDITDKLSVSAALGHQWLDVSGNYTTWNAGFGYALTDNVSASLRYHDTDVSHVEAADGRVVLSVGLSF